MGNKGPEPKIQKQKTVKVSLNLNNESKKQEFNIDNDPDMPEDAINSNIIIEEIEMNGKK